MLATLRAHLPWLARTSPPTACEGFCAVVAEARGVDPANILPGAGSSDLIFRAFRHWLRPSSSVLLLDPTYGEYAHVLEKVIGCQVTRLPLSRARNFAVNPTELAHAIDHGGYDLVVLVNPNSPTGQHLAREPLETLLRQTPAATRVWIDETYVDFVGRAESLERFARTTENVVVCKSMSKVYALSGLRAAYLCASPAQLSALRAITPPWVMSLLAQVAAVRALECPEYYAKRYQQTHQAREELATQLGTLGWNVAPGCANFLLAELPENTFTAREFVERCQRHDLFLRDATGMDTRLGQRMVRVAVKDPGTNTRMIEIIRDLHSSGA